LSSFRAPFAFDLYTFLSSSPLFAATTTTTTLRLRKASTRACHRGSQSISPARAAKYMLRSGRHTTPDTPAGLPLHRGKEGETTRTTDGRTLVLAPGLFSRESRALELRSPHPPARSVVHRADCGLACRETSSSSASRIQQCWHPSMTCCTVAQVRLRDAISGHCWSSSVTRRGYMMPS